MVRILEPAHYSDGDVPDYALWHGDVEALLNTLPAEPIFDLIVTSPPYNLGKPYEKRTDLRDDYLKWQARIIGQLVPRLNPTGSLCWQVGNFVEDGEIVPLDIEFAPLFRAHQLQLRNRIVWHFGHGLHTKRRFSGRYEVVLWYTKSKDYVFNFDAVRVPSITRGAVEATPPAADDPAFQALSPSGVAFKPPGVITPSKSRFRLH